MSYVELHCHSNFSLLDGASHPEELVARARDLGMPALALTDHDGLYGAVRFYRESKKAGIKPIIGAELTIDRKYHLTLLAKNNHGYSNLCRLITQAQLRHRKGEPSLKKADLATHGSGLICLSGCRKGEIASLLSENKEKQAEAVAEQLCGVFGDSFFIELQNNLCPGDNHLSYRLVGLARRLGIRYIATNNVHYAVKDRHRLYDVLVCIKNGVTLDKSGHLRHPNAEFYLKPAAEMEDLFTDYPEAVTNSLYVADQCNVDLDFTSYRFPEFPVPDGETTDSYLAKLSWEKAKERYGEPYRRVREQIGYELDLIKKLGLSGYFLIVWDIMDYARRNSIPAQGRGSAANSIVDRKSVV